jgi:hypothetical protein
VRSRDTNTRALACLMWLTNVASYANLERGSTPAQEFCLMTLHSDETTQSTHAKKLLCRPAERQSEVAGMALQVFIAHTGQRLQAEPGSFAS